MKHFFAALLLLCIGGHVFGQEKATADSSHYYRYTTLKKEHKWSEALQELNKAQVLTDREHIPDYLLSKSELLVKLGQTKEALQLVDSAFSLRPHETEPEMLLRRAVYKTDHIPFYTDALKDYDLVLKKVAAYNVEGIDTFINIVIVMRGNVKMQLRDYKGAYKDVYKVLQKEPLNESGLILMVNVLNWMGETKEINTYLNRLKTNFPGAETYGNIAYSFQNQGFYKEAIAFNDMALGYDYSYKDFLYNNRGFEKYKLNDLVGALEDINQAIAFNSENSFAFKNRALVYLALGEEEKACADMQAALEAGFTERYGEEVQELKKKHCK